MKLASLPASLLFLAVLAPPATAELDRWTLEAMGGTYYADCADRAGARVVITANEFVVHGDAKPVTATNLETAASWYGQDNPPEYRTVILSRMNDDPHLLLTLFEDAKGYYLKLGSAYADVEHVYSRKLAGTTFRRCKDEAAKPAPPAKSAPPPAAGASPALAGFVAPSDTAGATAMMKDKEFHKAYTKAMGPLMRHRWLAVLDGPSPPQRAATLNGEECVLVSACKAGDCEANNLLVAWAAKSKRVQGVVRLAGANELIGAPSPEASAELLRLWKQAWYDAEDAPE